MDRADLLESYAGVWSFRAIGRRLGIAPRTVQHLCYQAGIRPSVHRGWYTPAEVAELLGVTPQAVTKWCRSGRIRARRNPSWRYPAGRLRRDYRRRDPRWHWQIPPGEVDRAIASRSAPCAPGSRQSEY